MVGVGMVGVGMVRVAHCETGPRAAHELHVLQGSDVLAQPQSVLRVLRTGRLQCAEPLLFD